MRTDAKLARERKFYVMLPIIAMPFLTLLFWLLGGGTGANGQGNPNSEKSLNTQLPGSGNDGSFKDKLAYYEIAEKDSAKLYEQMQSDTNYRQGADGYYNSPGMYHREYGDPTTQQIYQNLSNLEKQMQQGYAQSTPRWSDDSYSIQKSYGGRSSGSTGYGNIGNEQPGRDPELDQLNTMLDKIMEIQNPELANERLKETTEKRRGQVYAVTTPAKQKEVTLLDGNKTSQSGNGGFYALEEKGFSDMPQNAIRAVVHDDQIIVNGSTVKMRLVDEVSINDVNIPKDYFIFGKAQLSGERLVIKIESIRYGRSLFPVDLSVFDLDGLDGVYIPGSITRDVVKQSADRPLQSISLSSLDQSWGLQAAGAGVEMVKGMFSKKAKLVRVKVKAGYQILLRDEKQKQGFNN